MRYYGATESFESSVVEVSEAGLTGEVLFAKGLDSILNVSAQKIRAQAGLRHLPSQCSRCQECGREGPRAGSPILLTRGR